MTSWEIAEISIDILRIFILALLIGFYLIFVISRNNKIRQHKADAAAAASDEPSESTGLLDNGSANGHANGYAATSGGGKHKHTEGAPSGWEKPTTIPSRTWWEYLKGYTFLFPYLWPARNRRLQITVVICFLIMVVQRVINILVPSQVSRITDILAGEDGPVRMPWVPMCLYIFYRLLQGNNGLLGALRSVLWIPVSQYSYRELSVASFEHVHNLSLEFHLGKRTGEVLSALGKGSSINTFLEQVTFQVVPMLVDLAIAIGYFLYAFDAYYALVLAIVTFWYVYITVRMAQWRAEIRRQMVNADREEDAVKSGHSIVSPV